MQSKKSGIIYTIGHSTRTLDDFINILQKLGITTVVDVRTIPRSWHNPQFNEAHLKVALHEYSIDYVHLTALGGLRHATRNSINTGWHNASFRGYADYMQTNEFENGLDKLIDLAKTNRIAIMCAESLPWHCHRSLIGDALLVRHFDVEDIYTKTSQKPHILTSFAKVHGTRITYPPTDN